MRKFTSIELCAGAGGAAFGIEQAGFEHLALVEIDEHACKTLKLNRPKWNVIVSDLKKFSGDPYRGIDLLSAGVPCPPFSVAGKQLGKKDDRDLFPEAIRLVRETKPKAVMIENVKGLMSSAFEDYRKEITAQLEALGYRTFWKLLNSSDFGVVQLRPRVVVVALKNQYAPYFQWPKPKKQKVTVGELLYSEMSSMGWKGAKAWRAIASSIAPTLVGGSKKHGGPDLGPTRARKAWAELGVNGLSLADNPPEENFKGMPRLTVQMAALIQGFPTSWKFYGKKTHSYRQVGNAFPPPVARGVAQAIKKSIEAFEDQRCKNSSPSSYSTRSRDGRI